MEIICLASSSAANSFVVKNENTAFLLEAGLDMKTTIQRLNLNNISISTIKAVVISHEHGDHARAAAKLSQIIPVFASSQTLEAIPNLEQRHPLKEWESAKIGTFRIIPFYVEHDVPGACGYLIFDSHNGESMLFATDTKYIPYDFSGFQFDYILIECNHIYDLAMNDSKLGRKVATHMSLSTTILALSKLDLRETKAIYLMHLSDTNSDENRMRKEIQGATGLPTYICQKNGGVV